MKHLNANERSIALNFRYLKPAKGDKKSLSFNYGRRTFGIKTMCFLLIEQLKPLQQIYKLFNYNGMNDCFERCSDTKANLGQLKDENEFQNRKEFNKINCTSLQENEDIPEDKEDFFCTDQLIQEINNSKNELHKNIRCQKQVRLRLKIKYQPRYVGNSTNGNLQKKLKNKPIAICVWFSVITLFVSMLFSDVQAQSAGERAAEGLKGDKPLQVADTIRPLYIGEHIPDTLWNHRVAMHLDTVGRDSVSLGDFRANKKVLIIDFWPTWCGPCVKSVLHLDSITRLKPYKNVQFISMNVLDSPERLKKFIARTQLNVPTLSDFSFLVNRMLTRYKGYYGALMIKDDKLLGAFDTRKLTTEELDLIEEDKWEELSIKFFPEMKKIYLADEPKKEELL